MSELSPIYRRAEIYDAVYRGRGRDYEGDSAMLAGHIRRRNATAASLLDVACGTGANLRYFAKTFDRVEGVDLAEDMLRVGRDRLPGIDLHLGDMRDFRLGRRFDAITCLFSSIGYLDDVAELNAAARCFGRHLNPGGVLALEPWHFPENATSGHVTGDVVTVDGLTISRISHTVRDGRTHHMNVHYLVADPGSGIEHFTDRHRLSLFTRAEYGTALALADLGSVEFVETGPGRPGLFLATKN